MSFVLGKGGVGRTTVATALAVDFATRGDRTLLIAPVGTREVEERIHAEARSAALGDRLHVLQVGERELVDDTVRRVTRLGPMADVVFRHPAYESFIDIVPGLKELALLNLVLEKRDGSGAYARIVIDGPATGHGLHFLEAPDKASRMLVGKLKDRADEMRRTLRDDAVTEVVLVTIPQEIPVRETFELAQHLQAAGFPIDNVIVNRWIPALFADDGASAALDKLAEDADARARLGKSFGGRDEADLAPAIDALRLVRAERREAEARLADLRRLEGKISLVPLLPDPEDRLPRVAEALRHVLGPAEVPP